MTNPTAPASEELGDHAKNLAQDAMTAAGGIGAEAKAIARSSTETLEERFEDAKELAGEAIDTVRGLRADLADLAKETRQVVGAYARQLTDVAADQLGTAKEAVINSRALCEDYVKREPVKASLIAAAIGAIATKLLLMALSSRVARRPSQDQRRLPDRY